MKEYITSLTNGDFQILDCSLRDGGYLNQWSLDAKAVEAITTYLSELPIDVIELGYASDYQHYGINGTLPPSFLEQLNNCLKESKKRVKLAIMLFQDEPDPISTLEKRIELFDLVRIPTRKEDLLNYTNLFSYCREKKIPYSINITKVSTYQYNELIEAVSFARQFQPNIVYFADSRGSLLPHDVEFLYQTMVNYFPEQLFGFHAHNNLSLALVNSAVAIHSGARYIDTSLGGLGLGGGNLVLEQLLFLIYDKLQQNKLDLTSIIVRHQKIYSFLNFDFSKIKFYLSGAMNIPQELVDKISDIRNLRNQELFE